MEYSDASSKLELFLAEETTSYFHRKNIALDIQYILKRLFQRAPQGVLSLLQRMSGAPIECYELVEWEAIERIEGRIKEAQIEAYFKTEPEEIRDIAIVIEPEFHRTKILDIFEYSYKHVKVYEHSLNEGGLEIELQFPTALCLALEKKEDLPKEIILHVQYYEDCATFAPSVFSPWSYSPKQLAAEGLYLLLPLRLLELRRRWATIETNEISNEERVALFREEGEDLKAMAKEIIDLLFLVCSKKGAHIKEIGAMYACIGSIAKGYAAIYPEMSEAQREIDQMIGSSFDELIGELFE